MLYEIIPPCAALGDMISHFWTGSWDASRPPNTTYMVIAGSLTELTFAFGNRDKPSGLLFSLLQGHTERPCQLPVEGFYHLLGVSFYAHAIPLLFGIPAGELTNKVLAPDLLLGPGARRLYEMMDAAVTMQQRISLLSGHFLSARKALLQDQLMIRAIQVLRKGRGEAGLDTLAREFCLSPKQFGRRFKAASGFNPKTYARIIRFESAISDCLHAPLLTDAAYNHGYYDQAHFIREFKSLSLFTPGDFRKLGAEQ